jgi:dephospho-CoA kinase
MRSPCNIGLTGGIGSGKSTVARLLAQRGAVVIDADAVAHSVTLPGGAAMPAIVASFGAEFMAANGALDRALMRELVYADADAKRRLEAIIHPLVALQTEQQALQATQAGCRCTVFDVPLLVESARWRQRLDRVLVIDSLPPTQIERVMARSSLTRVAVEKIIASQASREQRLKAADLVLFNDLLTLAQLQREVDAISVHFGL